MRTVQEALSLGSTSSDRSCPNFMNNYLKESTNYGGTVDDKTGNANYGYWTMSANGNGYAWTMDDRKINFTVPSIATEYGARAVVVVNK